MQTFWKGRTMNIKWRLVGLVIFSVLSWGLAGCGNNAPTPTPTDPYAGFDAKGVMEIYLKAYQEEHYQVCQELLGPNVGITLAELKAEGAAARQHYGAIEDYRLSPEAAQGAEHTFLVAVKYTGKAPGTFSESFRVSLTERGWRITYYTLF